MNPVIPGVLMLLLQGCGVLSDYPLAKSNNCEVIDPEELTVLDSESQERAKAQYMSWPAEWQRTRRAMVAGVIPTTAPPMPHPTGTGVPTWFGRSAPGGEGGSGVMNASTVLPDVPSGQMAIRITSWTWRDGLRVCWPAPVATERVYFSAGLVPGGICPADVVTDGPGWLIQASLLDLSLSPGQWVKEVIGQEWAMKGWRETPRGLYLLISMPYEQPGVGA